MSMPALTMTSELTLADLLQDYADAPAIPVSGIASDSRLLQSGDLFLAVQGMSSHGLDFTAEAREAGVSAIAWDTTTGTDPGDIGIPTIGIDDLAAKLGDIADRFYGSPSAQLKIVGVTGTNGKTTVAWLVAQALEILGDRCAYLGTLGSGVGSVEGAEGMTTPAAIELQGHLADFVTAGASSAAIEVSSHALSQGRVDGVRFDTALFTNLTRDHLDYHGDMDDYFASKAALFQQHAPKHRIVNVDTEFGEQLANLCGPETLRVSTSAESYSTASPYLHITATAYSSEGSEVEFASSWGSGKFVLGLPGDFNVANAALVLALLLNNGVALDAACDVMAELTAPPGRMQRVAVAGPTVLVDYAHTPDALEVSLQALRSHSRGQLWCVFGCGGDRDKGKRPQMGELAERFADRVVVTNDNPRSEDSQAIIDDILGGFASAAEAVVIEDRAAAIAWAVAAANDDDVVLVAGKGHESYQEANGERIAFSDYAVAEKALLAKRGEQ